MVESPFGRFAIFVGHVENGAPYPFEVWINGNEQPRAGRDRRTMSMDMRALDAKWLHMKLDLLARTGGDAFDCAMPPEGKPLRCRASSLHLPASCAIASTSWARWSKPAAIAVLDALFAKEPKTGTDGTMSWTVDVYNPSSEDDFVLMLKELVLPGQRRPYRCGWRACIPRRRRLCSSCRSTCA